MLCLRRIAADRHGRKLDERVSQQIRLNLARLDPNTANLHLRIQPPEIFDRSVVQNPSRIPGRKQSLRLVRTKSIGNETLGGEVRSFPVSACEAIATDVNFAGNQRRNQVLLRVENNNMGVGDRPSDGNGRQMRVLADFVIGGVRRHFGRTVDIEQLCRR